MSNRSEVHRLSECNDQDPIPGHRLSDAIGCRRREFWLLLIFSVLIALIFTRAILTNFSYWGIEDWDQHFFYQAVPRQTLMEYKQFPLWNPYYCGGTVMLANPQSRFLSPSFLFVLIFGTIKGVKLEIVLYLIIGLMGMYILARYFGMSTWAAALPAGVYMLSSMYSLNLGVGMTWFMSVAYLPWAYLFYLISFERWRYVLLSGLFLVLMYFNGGAYPLSITILFFFLFSLLSIRHYGIFKVAKLLSILLVFTLCLGAIKFIPSLAFLHRNPRHISDYSGYSVKMLAHSLLDRNQSQVNSEEYPDMEGFWDGMSYGMDENGMYIGFVPILLFALGIVMFWKRYWRLGVCFLIFLWLGFGDRIPISLWKLLHILPVYSSMRVAQRFRIVFMFCLALFAGFGLQTLLNLTNERKKARLFLRLLPSVISVLILADLIWVNSAAFKDAFTIPPLSTEKQEHFYQIQKLNYYDANGFLVENITRIDSSWSALYPAFLSNIGTIDAYETAVVPRNAIPKGSENYKGEAFFQETSGKLSIDHWSPNRVALSVNPDQVGYLVINQNYYPGWKVRGALSSKPQSLESLLAAKVSPESQVVEFYYSPFSFKIGLLMTCLALLVGIMLWVKERRSVSRIPE